MVSSLPNRCVHHYRRDCRGRLCLRNVGVHLPACLFSKRRPIIFESASNTSSHTVLSLLRWEWNTRWKLFPFFSHSGPSSHRSSGQSLRKRSTDRLLLQVCALFIFLLCFFFRPGADVCSKCQAKCRFFRCSCSNRAHCKATLPGCLSGSSCWSIKNGSYSVTLYPVK